MKRILFALFLIFILVMGFTAVYAKSQGNENKEKATNAKGTEKIEICHKPENQASTLVVAKPALKGHLNHGDYIGKCNETNNNNTNNNQTNQNKTKLSLSILNPTNSSYTNNTLLVNITSKNASNVWYNWNGTNVSYISPIYVKFNEGINTLNVYANNSDGKRKSLSVTFFVNSTIINNSNNTNNNQTNQTNQTLQIPETVSNLTYSNVTNSSIFWAWINPIDNFFDVIVFINGENLLNTTQSNYTALGLLNNTNYTLDLQTRGNNSLINNTNVSSTITTLP